MDQSGPALVRTQKTADTDADWEQVEVGGAASDRGKEI